MTVSYENLTDQADHSKRELWPAMWRGVQHTCPRCGKGKLYRAFLKVADNCGTCGEALHHHQADDAPPYFTIFIVGHIVVGGVLALEQAMKPSPWLHAAIWMPLTLILSLLLLPRIKGALVSLQWALRMHGFDDNHEAVRPSSVVEPNAPVSPAEAAPPR